MKKKKTEGQELIRAILGKDKFLMLNLDMIKRFGLNETLLLTYLLDKFDFYVTIDDRILENGMVFYRIDIEDKMGLSSYTQRKAEKKLMELGILKVEIRFDDKLTYNLYKIDMNKLVENLFTTPSNI